MSSSSSPTSSPFEEQSSFNLDQSLLQGKRPPVSTPRKRKRIGAWLSAFGIIILLLGVGTAVALAQTNFDLRQWAWGGVSVNQNALQGREMSLEDKARLQAGHSESAALFTKLTQTYFDADVANIADEKFQIHGVVFKKYDAEIDRTLVYARLVNMPLLDAVPAMWLERGLGDYLPAGFGELVIEDGQPVGYFMTTLEGNADEYETLNFSYDSSTTQSAPSSIYLSVEFKDSKEQQ